MQNVESTTLVVSVNLAVLLSDAIELFSGTLMQLAGL